MDSLIEVKRNENGSLIESCPIFPNNKIGSFDCTKNCSNNQNTAKELEKYGLELPKVRCSSVYNLKMQQQPKLFN